MNTVRSEKDSMGAIDVPADKLWGAQTQRSLEHFRISTEKMPTSLIHALALTKRAAAKVNEDLGLLSEEKASAIRQAADEVLAGQHDDEFPLAIWQTGSGTQSNMNMNEVLANRASELLGGVRGMERGTLSSVRDENGDDILADVELLRLAFPRRVFTLSQVKYVADRMKWLYDNRDLIGGLEFVEEPPVLRFFMGKLRAKSDWPEKLAAKYRQDFGESL